MNNRKAIPIALLRDKRTKTCRKFNRYEKIFVQTVSSGSY